MSASVVIDASVITKWLLADRAREQDTAPAQSLMGRVVEGEIGVRQPMHWLAETAAVLARLSPATARDDVLLLDAMDLPVSNSAPVLQRACDLAIDLEHHLFDTLYHAVALETEGHTLITADHRYLRKAARFGSIVALGDY